MRLLWQLGVVAILAGVVSAPQWLSTLAWLDQTNRNGLTLEAALPGAIHWQTLVTLLSGNVFSQGRGDSWAFGDISADYLYVGQCRWRCGCSGAVRCCGASRRRRASRCVR